MKVLASLFAASALAAAPTVALAQHGGGHGGGGGGFHGGGGGFHGGGFSGGFHGGSGASGYHGGGFAGRGGGFANRGGYGFRGGDRGWRGGYGHGYGWRGGYGRGYGYGYGGFVTGLAVGSALAWPYYGYGYGYPDGYVYGYPSDYYGSDVTTYDTTPDAWSYDYGASSAPPAGGACGQWVWNSSTQRYWWDTAGC